MSYGLRTVPTKFSLLSLVYFNRDTKVIETTKFSTMPAWASGHYCRQLVHGSQRVRDCLSQMTAVSARTAARAHETATA
eukprot:SAG31_NODE_28474_length_409_cov_2.345161_1_plen_79_part_00